MRDEEVGNTYVLFGERTQNKYIHRIMNRESRLSNGKCGRGVEYSFKDTRYQPMYVYVYTNLTLYLYIT